MPPRRPHSLRRNPATRVDARRSRQVGAGLDPLSEVSDRTQSDGTRSLSMINSRRRPRSCHEPTSIPPATNAPRRVPCRCHGLRYPHTCASRDAFADLKPEVPQTRSRCATTLTQHLQSADAPQRGGVESPDSAARCRRLPLGSVSESAARVRWQSGLTRVGMGRQAINAAARPWLMCLARAIVVQDVR